MSDLDFEISDILAPAEPRKIDPEKLLEDCRSHASDIGVDFTDEHAEAMLSIFCRRRNVMITGGAGVGKTWLIREQVIRTMERWGMHYGVCATTGIAGSHLSGRTIHSFLGIGLGPRWAPGSAPQDMSEDELKYHYKQFSDALLKKRTNNSRFQGVLKRLRSISHIILDEVSMMPGNALLGFIDYWLKTVRKNEEPFGGVRMIFCGDACQLPPVCANGSRIDWAFMSWSWQDAKVLPIELTKIFRQTDRHFTDLLNRVRVAEPFTEEDVAFLRSRVVPEGDRMLRTMLCSTNKEADNRNEKALRSLPGEATEFPAKFEIHPHHIGQWSSEEEISKELMRNKPVKDPLALKVGLPVLITVNAPEGQVIPYFNGSRATVVSLPKTVGDPITLELDGGGRVSLKPMVFTRNQDESPESTVFVDGKVLPRFPLMSQYPILPASGITCHRAQGMSLDECMVDLGRAFAPGQVYVALSRLRKPDGLWLAGDKFEVAADKHAIRFYQLIRKGFYK